MSLFKTIFHTKVHRMQDPEVTQSRGLLKEMKGYKSKMSREESLFHNVAKKMSALQLEYGRNEGDSALWT